MKFPRNARMFKGQLDAAPFACVLFCLLIFLLLALVVPIPGIPIHLPDALPGEVGIQGDYVTVALDVGGPDNPHGIIYFDNQIISEPELQRRLAQKVAQAVQKNQPPPALVLLTDTKVPTGQQYHLMGLAEKAGFKDFFEETLPPVFNLNPGAKGP